MESKTDLWVRRNAGQQSPVKFTIDTAELGIHSNELIAKRIGNSHNELSLSPTKKYRPHNGAGGT